MVLLPLCPVYGVGALLIVHLPSAVQARPVLLFLCGALAATAVEYGMDFFYEKVLGVRFWDYSALPWNLNGRVCLLFSAAWGLLSLGLTVWVHPAVTAGSAPSPRAGRSPPSCSSCWTRALPSTSCAPRAEPPPCGGTTACAAGRGSGWNSAHTRR